MERLVELLVFFVTELQKNKEIDESLIKFMLTKGYTRNEISIALTWIMEKLGDEKQTLLANFSGNIQSFRYLHEVERELFTPDGWHELNQLYLLGILDFEQMEMFIDRMMMVGLKQLDAKEVRKLASVLIFEKYSDTYMRNLLENDTIN